MSLFLMMFMGTPPIASLLSGSLAPHFGAPLTVGLTGGCCLLAAIWFMLRKHILEEAQEPETAASTLLQRAQSR
jgi:hypothetical protein